jgi:hypothetical protein
MKTTACFYTGSFSRARLMTFCGAVASTAAIFVLTCSNAAGQGPMRNAPAPNRNITLSGPQAHVPSSGHALPGTVEGFVYWDTHSVTHNPAGACSGFSVSVIAGGNVLAAASNQFGAKYIGQVKAFLANGTIEVYDVCTYAYDNLPENTPLRVELNITQPGLFSPAVAPATAIIGPLTIINAQCNMLPSATPTSSDLNNHWGSCQDMAFDVNFQLVPASLASRAATLPPGAGTLVQTTPGAANGSSSSGTLLTPGSNATLLGRSQQTTGGSTNSGLEPLVPRSGTNGTSSTSSGSGSGGGTNPTLQPLVPRGSSNSGSAGGTNCGTSVGGSSAQGPQFAAKLLKADLAKPPARGKVVTMTANSRFVSSTAAIHAALQKQRQAADAAVAAHVNGDGRAANVATGATMSNSRSGGTLGTSQTMDSTGNDRLASAARVQYLTDDTALLCAQDPTFRILSVSGSSFPATFTPTDKYNMYSIKGCSFGAQAPTNSQIPTDWVHIYGGSGSFDGKFAIKFWSDNEIDVSLDESITGFPDLDNLNLVVKRADGQQIQKEGFKFYAAREPVLLASIPQSWVTLASFPSPCGGSNTNCWYTEYSSPPASTSMAPYPAIPPPGPYAGSAYVGRSSNGLKYAWLDGVNDYYDFTHLAPGWTTDPSDQQHQPQLIPYDAKCPAGDGWTVTYKQSFGAWSAQWDGNNIRVGLSDASCSGFFAPSLGIDNYQNWSGSYYALKVWVTGPRGTDPLTDNPAH